MEENPYQDREGAPGEAGPAASPRSTPGQAKEGGDQRAEGGRGLRAVSRSVAAVAAGALVGGGIGLLVGVALGAINPFALGIVGAVVGIVVPVLFAVVARRARRGPWWSRVFGG